MARKAGIQATPMNWDVLKSIAESDIETDEIIIIAHRYCKKL